MKEVKSFKSKIRQVGNGKGLLIPSYICKYEEMNSGEEVEVIIRRHQNPNSTGNSLYTFPLDLNVAEVS